MNNEPNVARAAKLHDIAARMWPEGRPDAGRELDSHPFRNRVDGTRWPDDGGAPDLLPLSPRPEFEQDRGAYDHLLSPDPFPYLDTLSPSGRRYTERDPQPRPPWSAIGFHPRYGYAQNERHYPGGTHRG